MQKSPLEKRNDPQMILSQKEDCLQEDLEKYPDSVL